MIKLLMTLSISCVFTSCSSLSQKAQERKINESRIAEVKKIIVNRQYKEATEELDAMSIKDPYNLQVMQLKLEVLKLSQKEKSWSWSSFFGKVRIKENYLILEFFS